jgi:hypothetical protein
MEVVAVKEKFILGFLLAPILVLAVACNLGPNLSTCTIVAADQNTHGCNPINVSLDAGTQENIAGTSWTFSNITPGYHSLNFSTSGSVSNGNGSCSGQNPCGFGTANPPSTSQSVNFTTKAGYQYTVTLNNDGNFCGNIIISGP